MASQSLIVKARFDGRVFIPAEPVDLPVGSQWELSLVPTDQAAAGSPVLTGLLEIAETFPENPQLPADLAAQHDHYLYGSPKRP